MFHKCVWLIDWLLYHAEFLPWTCILHTTNHPGAACWMHCIIGSKIKRSYSHKYKAKASPLAKLQSGSKCLHELFSAPFPLLHQALTDSLLMSEKNPIHSLIKRYIINLILPLMCLFYFKRMHNAQLKERG